MLFGLFRGEKKVVPAQDIVPQDGHLAINNDCLGPVLWQDVRYGMSVTEVKSVRPDAVPNPKSDTLHDGASAELAISHLRLGEHDYGVLFYFSKGILVQITIKTNGGPSLNDFYDLTGALRLRYGREVEMKESHDSFSTAEWLSADGINVSLVCFPLAGCLNMNFQFRYANTAQQL